MNASKLVVTLGLVLCLQALRAEDDFSAPLPDAIPDGPAGQQFSTEGDSLEPLLKPRHRVSPKRNAKKRKGRGLASTSTARVRGKRKVKKSSDAFNMTGEVLGGLGFGSTSNTTVNENRNNQGIGQDFSIGGRVGAGFARYFGAEVEVIAGVSPSQELQIASGSSLSEIKRPSGFLWSGMLLASYPLDELQLRPKIGIGYTSIKMAETLTTSNVEHQISSTMKGVFGRVGASWRPVPEFDVEATFDFLVSGTNDRIHLIDGAQSEEASLPGGLTRFRVVGAYDLGDGVAAGLEFRSQQVAAVGAEPFSTGGVVSSTTAPSDSESQMRILALIRYQFL